MRIFVLFVSVILLANYSIGQTGPAGVGSAATNSIWLDAASLSFSNNDPIATWTDISGNGQNAVQSTPSAQPLFKTNQLNGFPSVRFDGSNDNLKIAAASGVSNQEITWFIVGNFNTTNVSQAMLHFSHYGSTNHKNLRFTLCYKNATVNRINSGNINTVGGGTPSLFTFGTSSQIMSTLINTTDINTFTNSSQTGTNSGAFLSPVGANRFVTLGQRAFINDYYLNGNISEVIVYNYEVTSVERILIENYLSSKYGISMSANDHYALEGSGHYYNVTGIGMEGGNSVTDAEGRSGVEISAASNLDNNEYLLWGHDNTSLTVNTTDVPVEFSAFDGSRLNRTWRIDETGDVGTYTVAIDMNSMPSLGLSTDDYVLIMDDDGDFSNGGTTMHSTGYTFSGGVATWTGVEIPDGFYFTVAYVPAIYSVTTGDWNDPNTWNCTCVPTNADNASISPTDIVTVSSAESINDLYVGSTGTLAFSGGNTLSITGNLDVRGILTGDNGIVSFDGSSAQTVNVSGSATYENLSVTNSTSVTFASGMSEVTGVLSVSNGILDAGSNFITLNSDATSTARIDELFGTITGTMTIERFISFRADGYSTMSSSVSNATFAQWADDMAMAFAPYVPNWSAPSAWGYDEVNYDFYAIESSGTAISPAIGYEVYLDNDGVAGNFAPTTLTLTGTPNQGDINVSVTKSNDGWCLIGNPYASYLSFSSFRSSAGGPQILNSYMVFDETISDYVTLSSATEIAPGQGFWVKANGSGTKTFKESQKSTTTTSTFRNQEDAKFSLRVSSEMMSYTSNTYFTFSDGENLSYNDESDITFLKVPAYEAPSLYSHSSEGDRLRVNSINGNQNYSLPLDFVPGIDGIYTIQSFNIEKALFEGYDQVILEDLQNGNRIDLTLNSYTFEASVFDNSDRFLLHLIKSPSSVSNNEVAFTNSNEGVFVNFNFTENTNALISVYNVAGQEISSTKRVNTSVVREKVEIPNNFQGIYIIRVIYNDKIVNQRFYKN